MPTTILADTLREAWGRVDLNARLQAVVENDRGDVRPGHCGGGYRIGLRGWIQSANVEHESGHDDHVHPNIQVQSALRSRCDSEGQLRCEQG